MNVPVRDSWHIRDAGARRRARSGSSRRRSSRGSTIAPIASATPTTATATSSSSPPTAARRGRSRTATGTTRRPRSPPTASGSRSPALREPDAENAFRKSQIYAANVETGEIRQLTHRTGTQRPAGVLARRQDDRLHVGRLDRPLGVGGVQAVDDERRRLERARSSPATLDRPISGVIWAPDNSGVYFNVESEGSKNLYFATPPGQLPPVTSRHASADRERA